MNLMGKCNALLPDFAWFHALPAFTRLCSLVLVLSTVIVRPPARKQLQHPTSLCKFDDPLRIQGHWELIKLRSQL